MARPVKHKTYHDGSFDKFMIDFKQYLNLELLETHVIQKGLISEEEFKRILGKPVPLEQKVENLVSVVRRKGPDAFVEFAGCIQKCQQTTPDDGNDTILMMLADELTANPDTQARPELNASTEEYTRMLLEVKEELSKCGKIDQVKFCLQRAKILPLPLINCINDYQSLFDVLERTRHLHTNDCDILISLAKMLRCPSIVRIVERYSKHCSLVKPPQPLEVPVGYGILSSWIEPVKLTVTMGRVRQVKNVLRQCTKMFRLQDVNFQGCEAETNQPWILHWRMTEDNTDSLLNQFSNNPKKFHNEGILKFEKKKIVDILDTSDLERKDMAESENPTVMTNDVEPVDSKNSEDLNCRICFGLLTDPQQSACCGQHFCYKCVCELSTPYCPLCKASNFHFFKDISFGRKLKETEVYCVNKKAGCLWQGGLGDLQKHLCTERLDGECKYQPIRCSNFGCNNQVRRLAMKLHISQCPHRPVSCNHCGATMNLLDLKNHNPCPKMQVQCPIDGCEAKITHLELFDHMEACEFRQVDCPITGCDVHLLKKDLNSHMESYVVKHQVTMNSRMKALEEKHTVDLKHARETVIMELEGKMKMLNKELSDKVEKLQNKVENLNSEQLKLSNHIDTMKKAEYFVSGLMEIAAKVRAENWRLYLHTIAEFSTQINYAVPVIVSLQNYSTKLELSSNPGGLSFRTAQFYSRRGYRMFLSINPNSQLGNYKGRYLAVCIHITEGDNDDRLLWPYEGRINIKLLNQLHDKDHYVYPKEYFLSRSNPNVKYHCVMRPINGSNQGWGYTDFILTDNLKKSERAPHIQYLVNDSLVFEVNVD